jgi:nitroreductase
MTTADRLGMTLGDAIFSLRAIRRLKTDPIPDEDLHTILEAAIQAPNGGNQQHWHFILVKGDEQRAKLAEIYHEAWWAKRKDAGINGPEDIPETDKSGRAAMRLADEFGMAPAVVLVFATRQGAQAMGSVIPSVQNMLLAARALGVGGTITTLHPQVDDRVREMFAVPEDAQLVYVIPLGYPRGRFGPVTRKPLEEVASLDRWGEPLGL